MNQNKYNKIKRTSIPTNIPKQFVSPKKITAFPSSVIQEQIVYTNASKKKNEKSNSLVKR